MYSTRQGGFGLIVYFLAIEDVLRFSSGATLTVPIPSRDIVIEQFFKCG
jgi:hypothetical protein